MTRFDQARYDETYDAELLTYHLAMVKLQQRAIASGERILIIFEGRDAAGKDGSIRRITDHLSTRATRVIAPPKPTDLDRSQWYFQRYVQWLPARGEIVILNRSWYNRGGVEPVMGFCTHDEHQQFLADVPKFEDLLINDGMKLVKLWLDVSRKEQKKRLDDRRSDPLKALKTSPLDEAAQSHFDDYSKARDLMLLRTHTRTAPWICVRSDDKRVARLNIMRHLLRTLGPDDIARKISKPNPEFLFPFTKAAIQDGRLTH